MDEMMQQAAGQLAAQRLAAWRTEAQNAGSQMAGLGHRLSKGWITGTQARGTHSGAAEELCAGQKEQVRVSLDAQQHAFCRWTLYNECMKDADKTVDGMSRLAMGLRIEQLTHSTGKDRVGAMTAAHMAMAEVQAMRDSARDNLNIQKWAVSNLVGRLMQAYRHRRHEMHVMKKQLYSYHRFWREWTAGCRAARKNGRDWIELRLMGSMMIREWKMNTVWRQQLRLVMGKWQPGVLTAGWLRWLWFLEKRQKAKVLLTGMKAVEKALCQRKKWFNMLSIKMLNSEAHVEELSYVIQLLINWNEAAWHTGFWVDEDGSVCRHLTEAEEQEMNLNANKFVLSPNAKLVFGPFN